MTPFAHAIAQQLGAPVPGAVVSFRRFAAPAAPQSTWEPKEGSLHARILAHLRKTPDQDVTQISAALGVRTSSGMYDALQELRRRAAAEVVRKAGYRNVWRATRPEKFTA